MYNINILTKCDDESVRVAIIASVLEMINSDSKFNIGRMKRLNSNSPAWNIRSRQEILDSKF